MKGFGRVAAAAGAVLGAIALASLADAGKFSASEVTLKVAGGPPFPGA